MPPSIKVECEYCKKMTSKIHLKRHHKSCKKKKEIEHKSNNEFELRIENEILKRVAIIKEKAEKQILVYQQKIDRLKEKCHQLELDLQKTKLTSQSYPRHDTLLAMCKKFLTPTAWDDRQDCKGFQDWSDEVIADLNVGMPKNASVEAVQKHIFKRFIWKMRDSGNMYYFWTDKNRHHGVYLDLEGELRHDPAMYVFNQASYYFMNHVYFKERDKNHERWKYEGREYIEFAELNGNEIRKTQLRLCQQGYDDYSKKRAVMKLCDK